MAPRKRKNSPSGTADASAAVIDEVQLRRSSRRKTATSVPEGNPEEKEKARRIKPDNKRPHSAKSATKEDAPAELVASNPTEQQESSSSFTQVHIPSAKENGNPIHCLCSYSKPPSAALVFTHGAGGGISAAAMVHFSHGFTSSDPKLGLTMFEGSMNLKGRAGLFDVVKQHELAKGNWKKSGSDEFDLSYGGRSMGARAAVIASHSDKSVKALVLASYPLISPNGDVRDKILLNIAEGVDVLFISGDHDSMCDLKILDEVRGKMKATTWFVKVVGADHGMNVRGGKKLKEGTEIVGKMTGRVAAEWLRQRGKEASEMDLSWDGEESTVVRSKWMAREHMKPAAKTEENKQAPTREGGTESATGQATAEAGNRKRRKVKK